MLLPSLSRAVREARHTVARFPLALAAGSVVAAVVMWSIEGPDRSWMHRLILVAGLGIPLFTASVVVAERHRLPARIGRPVAAGLAGALAALFFASGGWSTSFTALKVAQLALVAHLLVAVGPVVTKGSRAGFWHYNRFLFLQFLIASFYGFVLWGGLAIALAAIDRLLGIRVPGEAYGHLAALLTFVFHPWLTLTGVPRDYDALDGLTDYPVGLKVFTQFVLLPLVTVYLVILTLYLGRVLITATWPSGWIGYLVSSVSAAGVLALLLVDPIRERADSRWVNGYGRWFFVALLPSLAMLLLAIGKRVDQYGMTERRYFLLVLALWMLGIAVYYALTASRNIRIIPQSLALVALVTWFGPWGAYQISYRSQVARFERLLAANDLGRVGAVSRAPREVPFADRKELSAILDYLEDTRGPDAVARVVGVPERELAANEPASTRLSWRAMQRIGLVYVSRWQTDPSDPRIDHGFWIQPSAPGDSTLDIRGFETLTHFDVGDTVWVVAGPDSITVRARWTRAELTMTRPGEPPLAVDLAPMLLRAVRGRRDPNGGVPGPVVLDRSAGDLRVRLILSQLSGMIRGDTVTLHGGLGVMLVGPRRPE